MALNGVTAKEISLEQTAKQFRDSGVDLIDWTEGNQDHLPMIRFRGDQDQGFQVVEVARTIGLWPIDLHRVWYFRYDLEKDPKWELYFTYPPAEGQFDANQLDLMVKSLSYKPLNATRPSDAKQSDP